MEASEPLNQDFMNVFLWNSEVIDNFVQWSVPKTPRFGYSKIHQISLRHTTALEKGYILSFHLYTDRSSLHVYCINNIYIYTFYLYMHLIGSHTYNPTPHPPDQDPPPSLGGSPRNFRTPSPSPGGANGFTPLWKGKGKCPPKNRGFRNYICWICGKLMFSIWWYPKENWMKIFAL